MFDPELAHSHAKRPERRRRRPTFDKAWKTGWPGDRRTTETYRRYGRFVMINDSFASSLLAARCNGLGIWDPSCDSLTVYAFAHCKHPAIHCRPRSDQSAYRHL
jgi:hypothetical protein